MASLLVIEGCDRGTRFELPEGEPAVIGRDCTVRVRLHDAEVSRRHAEIRPGVGGEAASLIDLSSANGTMVNGQYVDQVVLRTGDHIRVGQTLILYAAEVTAGLAARVGFVERASGEDRSAIVKALPAGDGSKVLSAPEGAGPWLKQRLAHLAVLYHATQATSHVIDLDALLERLLDLVFDTIEADRGTILLWDGKGALVPKAVRWRGTQAGEGEERVTISRTITDHVLEHGQGVITTDAPADARFGGSESIVDYAIREAMCVPLQGRHGTVGVLYADMRMGHVTGERGVQHFTQDHLMLMLALGTQIGLAIENQRLYQAKLEAERLAAIGQTIATISHHIKNILQGLRGGNFLIEMGLNQNDPEIVRRGWGILEKNQGRIYDLVLDMLTFSKEREPSIEPGALNETVGEVVELIGAQAREQGVELVWEADERMGEMRYDQEGIHRAVLNVLTNALEACVESANPRVVVKTEWDSERCCGRVVVSDNGPGVAAGEEEGIFEVFQSSKGSRGTGLGLPVSRKIAREHGGDLVLRTGVGSGATFVMELPSVERSGGVEGGGTDEHCPGATAGLQ